MLTNNLLSLPRWFVALAALAALIGLTANSAQAQTLQPGLWEVSTKMHNAKIDQAMAQMQAQMANMPAEQSKMMQDMMAQKGVGIGMGPPGSNAVRMCFTAEMLQRNTPPASNPGKCQQTYSARSGNSQKFSFSCAEPPSSGEGTVTYQSSSAYTSSMTINTTVKGQPERMTMDSTAKLLGPDCGNIKPMGPKG